MEPTHLRHRRGFTIVELIVVLAIVGILTIVTLNSQSSFNKTLILANTAYDIALTMRSAETFGLGSRGVMGTTVANAGYGLHLEKVMQSSFILFADTAGGASCSGMTPTCKPGDSIYTVSADALVRLYTLGNGVLISNFCITKTGNSTSCANSGNNNLSALDIVFTRPNASPVITGTENGNPSNNVSRACLVVASSQGGSPRYISVTMSGSINANAASCP